MGFWKKTKEAKERFKDWNEERARSAKIRSKERYEAYMKALERQEEVAKKKASIRKLQQKSIPKVSPRQTATGLGGPAIFDFGARYEKPKPMLPTYRPPKKKDKKYNEFNLFDGL